MNKKDTADPDKADPDKAKSEIATNKASNVLQFRPRKDSNPRAESPRPSEAPKAASLDQSILAQAKTKSAKYSSSSRVIKPSTPSGSAIEVQAFEAQEMRAYKQPVLKPSEALLGLRRNLGKLSELHARFRFMLEELESFENG